MAARRDASVAMLAAFSVMAWIGHAVAGETVLIRARRVYPVSAPPIDAGQIVVRDGKIAEVGTVVSVKPGDPGVRVVEAAGSVLPGLIDCGCVVGVSGRAAEEFRELTPEIRVLDGVDLASPVFARAFEAGVTCVAVSPGARNVVGGLGAVVRTGPRAAPRDRRVLARDAFLEVSLGEEASSGNSNLRFARPFTYTFRIPNTRMGTVFLARRALLEASGADGSREHLSAMLRPEGRKIFEGAMRGKPPIRIFADARQEVTAALRLAAEFGVPFQLLGAGEAAGAVEALARQKVPVILYPGTTARDQTPEVYPGYSPRLPALLAGAGVRFAFFSHEGEELPLLRERAAMAIRFGLAESAALEALTLGAARILGVDARVGSIEPGKDADLLALGGDPFDVTAPVLWVLAAGEADRVEPTTTEEPRRAF